MIHTEVLIVGGGPAGAACAWRLRRHGVACMILDREAFPRLKLCAGWIPPEVFVDLDIDSSEYPHGLTRLPKMRYSVRGLKFALPSSQYAIRRFEFDHWLLARADVPVETHHVRTITREQGAYVVDDAYSANYLVGAGGTNCPVYRSLFSEIRPRSEDALIVTQEEEFPYADSVDDLGKMCHLWFLEDGLPGYAWYVPKAEGYVNVGVGGKLTKLRARDDDIKRHWDRLVDKLAALGLVRGYEFRPKGHAYYLREEDGPVQLDHAFIVGDAAGLATVDFGEGIGPAVKSGLLAADAIVTGDRYTVDSIRKRSVPQLLLGLLRRAY
ncbi:MAG: NAD(P)/FAD-dependent oxidoreductase [Anaerolineae bacterium]